MKLLDKQLLNMGNVEVFLEPFPYSICSQIFSNELSEEILSWLENDAIWKLVETDFYEQYEFSFFDINLPKQLEFLTSNEHLSHIKSIIEILFSVKLTNRIDLTAHKLISGQRIRIHNDYIPNCETHRLLIQLNRGWQDENGGMLILFNSGNPSDIHKIIRPFHNSSVGFAISSVSHHAVSTIHSGERFTLVYSFYQNQDE